jgi:tRNA G10  N-methylase Trm11
MSAVATPQRRSEPLTFAHDRGVRSHFFAPESFGHWAKLHLGLLGWIVERYTVEGDTLLDPMAGTGSLMLAATVGRHVIVRDVEPAYLALLHTNAARFVATAGLFDGRITVGQHDAREPWGLTVDHIICSPPYGNEVRTPGVRFQQRDRMEKLAYTSRRWRSLLRKQQAGSLASYFARYQSEHPANIGNWRGERYWAAITAIYGQAHVALRPDGYMILVLKDHISHGRRVHTADETVALCEGLGFVLVERHERLIHPLSLWQRRRQERGEQIVEREDVLAFKKGEGQV